jgi:RNA polymerase sigma-70 factor (ECF subfamily)
VLALVRKEQTAPPTRLRALTAALARGDDLAWREFHRDYGPALFRYLLGGTRGDYDLAAEALQQAYLRVARYVRPCDAPSQFDGWLRVVAGSALNDCRRRRKSFWSLLHRAEPESSIDEPTDDLPVFAALEAALKLIDPADRALLEEKYYAGTDVRTLAQKLRISPKAAESRLTRARAELRRHLAAALSRHE